MGLSNPLLRVEKSSGTPNPLGLTDGNWPSLPQPSTPLTSGIGSVPRASHFSLHLNNKLLQCVSLTSKQILIDYGPSNPDDLPRDKSIEAQRTLRGMFNDWIDISAPPVEDGAAPLPPSCAIRSVSIFDPSVLLVGSGPLLRMAEYSSLFGILSFIFEHIQLGTMFYGLSA